MSLDELSKLKRAVLSSVFAMDTEDPRMVEHMSDSLEVRSA